MTSRILIIAPLFAPGKRVGAQRVTKLAIGLRDRGWSVKVLTIGAGMCAREVDPSFRHERLQGIEVERVRAPCFADMVEQCRHQAGFGRVKFLLLRSFTKFVEVFRPLDSWFFPWNERVVERAAQMAQSERPDLLWATVPDFSGALTCHRVSKKTSIPYVIDFRDVPLKLTWTGRAFSRKIMQAASAFSYCAPRQAEAIENLYPGEIRGKPSTLMYNCLDPVEIPPGPGPDSGKPEMLYGGSLYGGRRRISFLLDALGALKDGITLRLYLPAPEVGEVTAAVRQRGLQDCVFAQPLLPRQEFLDRASRAAILLVVVGHNSKVCDHESAIPAKVFDCLSLARPILVAGPEGCEAGRTVERLMRGASAIDTDKDDIVCRLLLVKKKRNKHGKLDMSAAAVEQFESGRILAQYGEFLCEAAQRGNR